MGLRDLLDRFKERKSQLKHAQDDDMVQTTVVQRKKSANERELERFNEEEREKNIKIQLERIRKQKRDEFFHGPSLLKQKNIFKGHDNILTDNKKLMSNDNMFKGKGSFMGKASILNNGKGGFI
jgi:hypothetical protein|tara:strand:+ start:711 stop:1082 length:372 start_codon:yes stop_codon:yes gene_type:complete